MLGGGVGGERSASAAAEGIRGHGNRPRQCGSQFSRLISVDISVNKPQCHGPDAAGGRGPIRGSRGAQANSCTNQCKLKPVPSSTSDSAIFTVELIHRIFI